MSPGNSAPRRPRAPRDQGLIAAISVLILLFIGAVCVRAGASAVLSTAPAVSGRALTQTLGILEAVGVAAAVIVLATTVRRPRRQKERSPRIIREDPWPWWVRAAALLVALVTVALPPVLLFALAPRHGATAEHLGGSPAPAPAHSAAHTAGTAGAQLPLAVVLAVAVVAVALLPAAAALAAGRRRDAGLAPEPEPRQPGPPLAAAADAGARALAAGADPRAAIIGCYRAMEDAFAGAGAAPSPSDTPAEVLARAAAGGLAAPDAAGALTALFRQARYSVRPMTEQDRDTARVALARLRSRIEAGQ